MMTDRKKKKKRRTHKSNHKTSSSASRVDEDVLEKALRADCSMLMASSSSFGNLITLLIQVLTLLVLLLLSIVLSLLADDSTAVSYILLVTLLLTLLVYELGVTRWTSAYASTFRLVILWNLWISAAVLFKLYSQIDVFGRVMGVLMSVFSTSVAVISLFFPQLAALFSFLVVLLLLFPLTDTGLFGDSTLVLSMRLCLYIILCIFLDRILRSGTSALDGQQQNTIHMQLSVCCFWVLLVLPQFWVASLLLLLIAWYKKRQTHKTFRVSPEKEINHEPQPNLDPDPHQELPVLSPSMSRQHDSSGDVSIDFGELFKGQ